MAFPLPVSLVCSLSLALFLSLFPFSPSLEGERKHYGPGSWYQSPHPPVWGYLWYGTVSGQKEGGRYHTHLPVFYPLFLGLSLSLWYCITVHEQWYEVFLRHIISKHNYSYGPQQTLRKNSFIVEGGSLPSNRHSTSPPSLALDPWETMYFEKGTNWQNLGFQSKNRVASPPKLVTLFFDQNPKFRQGFLKNTRISKGIRTSLGVVSVAPVCSLGLVKIGSLGNN